MDIATIVGLLGAFGLIFASIDDIGAFIDTPSILIVLCGSAMVTMARSSLAEFLSAGGVAGNLAGTITSAGVMTLTAGGAGTSATGQFVSEITIGD